MVGQEERMHCSTLGILGVITVPSGFKEAELGLSMCLLIWLRSGLDNTDLEVRFLSSGTQSSEKTYVIWNTTWGED